MIRILSTVCCLIMFPFAAQENTSNLKPWPEDGPPLLFEVEGIGNGYSAPVLSDEGFFISGEIDSIGYLFAYDMKGQLRWKSQYGPEWTVSYQGSRATPTLIDNLVYICSGMGNVVCFDAETGELKWSVDLIRDFEGKNATYGYSMTLAVDGKRLFCSPGGLKNNVVALNRFNGKLIWSSPALGETAGYGSPLIVDFPTRKLLVTASEFNILGIDADTGELLWTYELSFKGDLPCNTPIYDGEHLYWVAGPGNGAVGAKLMSDGAKMKIAWKNPKFDSSFGGFVQMGKQLYGSSDSQRKYVSLDTRTGRIINSVPFSIGSIAKAGKMLVAYNQRGQVGLMQADEDKLQIISSFKINKGTKEHFSHVLARDNRLFIRHGNVLQVFSLGHD